MATLEQLYQAVQQLSDALATAVSTQKFSPKQITIINGLSELSSNLGSVHAGEFLALSKGDDPSNLDAIGSFVSAIGRIFNSKTYHIGGVYNGDLKWGANAVTGELEAGDGAVVLSEHGVSIYDGTTEVGRLGNLNGFLSYSTDTFGIAIGNASHYFTYDAVNGVQVYGAIVSDREILLEDRTYYVRTDGSDTNTGLTNTAAGAFLTIQRAIDCASLELDTRQYNITIQIADGTYNSSYRIINCANLSGTGTVTIKGNETTPGNVILNYTSTSFPGDYLQCYMVYSSHVHTKYYVSGFKLTASGYPLGCLLVMDYSSMYIKHIEFGACGSYLGSFINVTSYGYVIINGPITISGEASNALSAFSYGLIGIDLDENYSYYTMTVSGNPDIDIFANVGQSGCISVASPGITFSGTSHGYRFQVIENGIIAGYISETYFPGDVDGVIVLGGRYSSLLGLSGDPHPKTIQNLGTALIKTPTSSSFGWTVNSSACFGGYACDTSSAASNADYYSAYFSASVGTYKLRIYGMKTSESGKVDIYIDNVKHFSGVDFYAGSTTYGLCLNTAVQITSTADNHIIKLVVNGHNEHSTDYVVSISMIELIYTTETSFVWKWITGETTGGTDTYLSSTNTTSNYGTADTLYTGESSASSELANSLIGFSFANGDFAPPIGTEISNVKLTLTTKADNSSTASDLSVYLCKRIWTEAGATWETYDGANSWNAPGGWSSADIDTDPIGTISLTDSETLDTAKDITLDTATMQSFLDGNITNCGLHLGMSVEADDQYGWHSSKSTTEAYRPTFSCTWTFA